ncbi:DUF4097 family beta strand repeat-containing protein [Fodinicola acaciae]|uniref:DUF4097 family beta strand repeat-containing protein n=1 Tax=Fodinicola acaciae TaxID=2681555 RepID=UPI0013D1D668|nr:DUF4097 family beta strand repeat-containing protein [Fodinicola acaciae]
MRNGLLLLAVVGVGASLVSACGVVPQSVARDAATLTSQVRTVRLDNKAGDVTVRGASGVRQVSVERVVHFVGSKPGLPSLRVNNGILQLDGCPAPRCDIDYVVTVPTGTTVEGKLTAGDITLSTLAKVSVESTFGDINADGISGDVRVQSQNGTVNVALAKPANVQATLVNGDVTVSVPAGRYRVDAQTTRGDRNVSLSNDSAAAYHVDVRTTNGDVTVKQF